MLGFIMLRRPPISTLTDTLFPYTTLFRSPLLVFGLEPNCPYCRKAWPDLWTLVQDGKLRLRIVLTAFLKDVEDAKDKATAVLLAEDRGAMLHRLERGETFRDRKSVV